MSGFWVCFIIGSLGFIPLLMVLIKRKRTRDLITKGDIVMGRVINVVKTTGHKGGIYYRALIEYPVFNQGMFQGYHIFSGKKGHRLFHPGRSLEIYYNKKNPTRFIPKDANSNIIVLIMFIIFFLAFVVFAYFLYTEIKGQHFYY